MKPIATSLIAVATFASLALPSIAAASVKCSPDSVKIGPACVDKWESSIWQIPATNTKLIKKVQMGKAKLADLQVAGVVQLGCLGTQAAYPVTFPQDGNWSVPVYAASVPGVLPSTCVSWFQANQACQLSGKRLLTNAEWQGAAAGTLDSGTDDGLTLCNIGAGPAPSLAASNTGSRSVCVSKWGAFDMVGNVHEWVADWGDRASTCSNWTTETGILGGDQSCFGGAGGAGPDGIPSALFRGGDMFNAALAGVFTVDGRAPTFQQFNVGFRCGS